jgi:hypothetical protein
LILAAVGLLFCTVAIDKPFVFRDFFPEQPEDPREFRGPEFFRDATEKSGIRFTYKNGEEADQYTMLESLGGGLALIDYDGDGLLDLFFPGGGSFRDVGGKEIQGLPPRLYRNRGRFKFQDVTKEVGLDQTLFYSHGAAVLDYDRDGWPDLLVTGYGRVALYRNVADPQAPGGRRFVEVTKEAGLLRPDHFWSTSAACGDLDGDGYPDIYLCQYVNWSWANNPESRGFNNERDIPSPKKFQAVPHALYRNSGKGGFVDATREAGLRVERPDGDYGRGLGVLLVDVNNDGRPDIYVANDTTGNFLYRNVTTQPGALRFEDIGGLLSAAKDDRGVANGSRGVDAGDYDGSGLASLWVTNNENELHALYRNEMVNGRQRFLYSTRVSDVAAIGQLWVGWGTTFLDSDNRGLLDIFVSHGHFLRHPFTAPVAQQPMFLFNRDGGKFQRYRELNRGLSENGGRTYFESAHRGRGVAVGDLNNDGLPDLVISHVNEPVVILRNVSEAKHHWLGVELSGKDHRDVVGARLVLEVGARKLTRFAKGGGSYLSSSDPRHVFGLGQHDKVGRLKVYWPSGEPRVEHFDDLAIDLYHRLWQGGGKLAL